MIFVQLADFQNGQEKIVPERKKESMRSARWLVCVAESLGGGIDSREKTDLWLLQVYQLLWDIKCQSHPGRTVGVLFNS